MKKFFFFLSFFKISNGNVNVNHPDDFNASPRTRKLPIYNSKVQSLSGEAAPKKEGYLKKGNSAFLNMKTNQMSRAA
jgi:hypothetical protein